MTEVLITASIKINVTDNEPFKTAHHFITHLVHCAEAGYIDFTNIDSISLGKCDIECPLPDDTPAAPETVIVWFKNFNNEDEFNGVFSSRDLAQEYINKFTGHDKAAMRIEPSNMDGV